MEHAAKYLLKYIIHKFEVKRKAININICFLLLHIFFTLNTILLTFISLFNNENLAKIDGTSANYLNITSILFALISCVIILFYELIIISNCRKQIKFIVKCVICSWFFISSKSLIVVV